MYLNNFEIKQVVKKSFLILILLSLIFLQNIAISQELELLSKIDLTDPAFNVNLNAVSINLYYKNKKLFKSVVGYEFNEILKKKFINIENDKFENIIFIAHSKDGISQKFSYSDLSPNISKIPAFIAFREKIVIKDTTRIENFGKSLTKKNTQQIDDLATFLKLYKIYLQFNTIQSAERKRIFSNYFLIFPQDQSTKRWIGNLDYIEIYNVKNINR